MENSQAQTPGFRDRRPDALGDLNVFPDELICFIIETLAPRDVARLACVSSAMYIFCNEEPLWMGLCLGRADGPLQYKGSWKKTAMHLEGVPNQYLDSCQKLLHFDGFNSLFLYRRLYRCHTTLKGFSFDDGNVDRRNDLSLEEFYHHYDGQKPVLLAGLADTWPARSTWTIDQLSPRYGETKFRISGSSRKVSMKFKDYVTYIDHQHDEDPLYIFDDKFGEAAPDLLKDYSVPHLFQEDLFDVLDKDQRPPFRWLIIGPERSGASWHVDPALTSAWNTLLSGRKRWAMYPPGRLPLGVTMHVNDEDGDVHIDSPSSLQWWLDFYPLLGEEDKPIECTQLPGETIFVPSGWWHCVLNLETTVAVTQNFVNSKNFEFVCLDMAPGYRHKGVCRAGLQALDEGSFGDNKKNPIYDEENLSYPDLQRKEKRIKIKKYGDDTNQKKMAIGASKSYDWKQDFSYNINYLATFLDIERDHYNAPWSSSNCIGQREMREWLSKLWVQKPGMRELIWKGACLSLNADKWLECLTEICAFHNMPSPTDDERLPVGTGSNPVYLIADCVVKIFVEGGLEASLYCLGTELQFYNLLSKTKSPLKNHVPEVLAHGILYFDNGSYHMVPWDGKGVPDVIGDCDLVPELCAEDEFPFGVWTKKQFEYKKAGLLIDESISMTRSTRIWPFIITKRCKGKIFAELRDALTLEDAVNLASFLGEQLRNLHLLPYPPLNSSVFPNIEQKMESPFANGCIDDVPVKSDVPPEWDMLIRTLIRKKKVVTSRLTNWGHPIPGALIEKVNEYLPDDFAKFFNDESGLKKVSKPSCWIHSDIMDDNIHMEPYRDSTFCIENEDVAVASDGSMNGYHDREEGKSWSPTHILDFSDISIGDPLYDVIPICLDIFRGDPTLLKQFLESYKLPFLTRTPQPDLVEGGDKFTRLSYHAMCFCILHEENILGAIFSIWRELRTAKSWEEVEQAVWGELNNYEA
ncbi:F-box protein At1g78280 isoform X2 [Tripterygium wilfordii]|uniref:F-box protein At1g78280 isoform X2 n=1 Tax=Tripterygium wilfordii TaxID=458696 RepID=UPI0018F827BD|nr:F-box protein At1g78280 isoform X2 [Tripterygium wilfordii]